MRTPIEIYGISIDKQLELAKILYPEVEFCISEDADGSCITSYRENGYDGGYLKTVWPSTGELLEEIRNSGVKYKIYLDGASDNFAPIWWVSLNPLSNNATRFQSHVDCKSSFYECLIKATARIRRIKK